MGSQLQWIFAERSRHLFPFFLQILVFFSRSLVYFMWYRNSFEGIFWLSCIYTVRIDHLVAIFQHGRRKMKILRVRDRLILCLAIAFFGILIRCIKHEIKRYGIIVQWLYCTVSSNIVPDHSK